MICVFAGRNVQRTADPKLSERNSKVQLFIIWTRFNERRYSKQGFIKNARTGGQGPKMIQSYHTRNWRRDSIHDLVFGGANDRCKNWLSAVGIEHDISVGQARAQ